LCNPDPDAFVASQIFLQLRQRPIRLLFHPGSQILRRLRSQPALWAALTSRRSFHLPCPAQRGRDLLGPAFADMKALGKLSQAPFSLLVRFQKLSTQII
jgi:hypothetical protein